MYENILLICFFFTSFMYGAELHMDKYLWIQQGTVPICIVAPHGGSDAIPTIAQRAKGTHVRDLKTFELVEQLNTYIIDLLKEKPYIVAARVSRRYIDFNRSKEAAFESDECEPIYDEYHNTIKTFIAHIKATHTYGILLDIHGQAAEPHIIFCGTNDQVTITSVRLRYGESAYKGANSIAGYLHKNGYSMHPQSLNTVTKEDSRFDGGYTVQTYGSHQKDGIDAMQLEIGRALRDNEQRQLLCLNIAQAIINFYKAYITQDT